MRQIKPRLTQQVLLSQTELKRIDEFASILTEDITDEKLWIVGDTDGLLHNPSIAQMKQFISSFVEIPPQGTHLEGLGFVRMNGENIEYIPDVSLENDTEGVLPISKGGNGVATPGLVEGSSIRITGTWPNQIISNINPVLNGNGFLKMSGTTVYYIGKITLTGGQEVTGILPIANGGTGSVNASLNGSANIDVTGTWPNNVVSFKGQLPIVNGGNGPNTPGLVAGANISIGGNWPNQIISSTAVSAAEDLQTTLNAGAILNKSNTIDNGIFILNIKGKTKPDAIVDSASSIGSSGQALMSNGSGGLVWGNVSTAAENLQVTLDAGAVLTKSNTIDNGANTLNIKGKTKPDIIVDGASSVGTNGQYLQSTGSGLAWATVSTEVEALQPTLDAGATLTKNNAVILGSNYLSFSGSAGLATIQNTGPSILQLDSTTKGFLLPRMTTAQRDAIVGPVQGLQIYNTTNVRTETYNGTSWVASGTSLATQSIGITLDGGGSILTTGQKGYIQIPYNATITGWTIISKEIGSVTFDIWKRAGAKPTIANTICAGNKPTLTSADYITSTAMSGWATAIAAGDIIGWNLDSVAVSTWVVLELTIIKI